MEKIVDGKREVFICDCNSLEHQYSIWYDEEDNQLWFEPHLVNMPWYLRIGLALKYVFGHKSNYGDWDSTIVKVEDMPRLIDYMANVISEDKKRENMVIKPSPSVDERDVKPYDSILNNEKYLDDEN